VKKWHAHAVAVSESRETIHGFRVKCVMAFEYEGFYLGSTHPRFRVEGDHYRCLRLLPKAEAVAVLDDRKIPTNQSYGRCIYVD